MNMGGTSMPNLELNMSDSPLIWIGVFFLFVFIGWAWQRFWNWLTADDTPLSDNRPTASDTTGDGKGDTFGN